MTQEWMLALSSLITWLVFLLYNLVDAEDMVMHCASSLDCRKPTHLYWREFSYLELQKTKISGMF